MYYCSSAHQLIGQIIRVFVPLSLKIPTNKYKNGDIIKDQEDVILQVKVKKTKKSVGLLLRFDTQHKVVFISDIVNSTISVFLDW